MKWIKNIIGSILLWFCYCCWDIIKTTHSLITPFESYDMDSWYQRTLEYLHEIAINLKK